MPVLLYLPLKGWEKVLKDHGIKIGTGAISKN